MLTAAHAENKTVHSAKTSDIKKAAKTSVADPQPVQAKLIIGAPDDAYEREANQMAEQLVNTPHSYTKVPQKTTGTPLISRMSLSHPLQRITEEQEEDSQVQRKVEEDKEEPSVQRQTEEKEEDTTVQRKAEEKEDTPIQRSAVGGAKNLNSPGISARLKARRGLGKPLSDDVQMRTERFFGADFSGIRMHTDIEAVKMSRDLNAHAFTYGSDIYFNQNTYDPTSSMGIRLLGHELTHTIHQNAVPKKKQEKQKKSENIKTDLSETHKTQVKTPAQNNAPQKAENSVTGAPALATAPARTNAAPATASNTDSNNHSTSAQFPATDQNIATIAPVTSQGTKNPVAETTKEQTTQQAEEKIVKAPADPESDPAFQAVIEHTKKVKTNQKTHDPAENKKEEITMAAKLSAAEQKKKNAQSDHIEVLNAETTKERKPITAGSFKKLLKENMKTLEDQLPTDQDSAEEFKENKPISKAKEGLLKTVKAENEKYTGPVLKEAGKKEPPASKRPVETPQEIKRGDVGEAPKPINAKAAVPKPKHDSEISMQKESRSLDDYMTTHEITEQQLAGSNEPEFLGALNSKTEAQAAAAEAPKKYREAEKAKLGGAVETAKKSGNEGLSGMSGQRADSFGKVFNSQKDSEKDNKEKQKKAYEKLENIYKKTKKKVTKKLEKLSTDVDEIFSNEAEKAKNTFEKNVEKKLDDIYGWLRIDDKIFGEDTEAIENVFKTEKQKFITAMDKVLNKIAKRIANDLNSALKDIENGKKESDKFFNTLSEDQQKLLKDTFDDFNDKYKELEDTVNDKQKELAQDLAEAYRENVDSLQESFDKIKEETSTGWIDGAMNALAGVVEIIGKLKTMLFNLLSAAADAIHAIVSDPIGFLLKLIAGVKLGFQNFRANIKNHIIAGFITWLTGSLKGVGITIPKDLFSLKGIFSLIIQVLGLTKEYFRAKAIKLLGEKTVSVIETGAEKGMEIFRVVKEKGVEGLWEYIKEQFNDLKEVVMDAIKEMVISKVINAGIKWIMGILNPVGAFIKAAMLIKDIVVFFVEKATQIIELVTAFINSIRALAAGNVGHVAKAIETALIKAVPVLIGFLASLLGITGLTAKVQKIIKKVRARIDRAIDKLIKKIKKKFKNLVKKGKAKVKDGVGKLVAWWKIKKKFKTKDGENHSLYFEGTGNDARLIVASNNPKGIRQLLNEKWKSLDDTEKKQLKKDFDNAKKIDKELNKITKLKRAEKTKETTSKAKEISALLSNLVPLLKTIGIDFDEELPLSHVAYSMEGGKAGKVVAEPLTKNPGNTKGSEPRLSPGNDIKGWDYVKKIRKNDSEWVRLHLLNHNLHGPGRQKWNLTPGLSHPTNLEWMHDKVEKFAKEDALQNDKVLWYETDVNYGYSKFPDFPSKISMKYGLMKKEGGKYKGRNKAKVSEKFSPAPPPSLEKDKT